MPHITRWKESHITRPAVSISMFFEEGKQEAAHVVDPASFHLQTSKNHAKDFVPERTSCSVVVTEGTDSFYAARSALQMLHNFANHRCAAMPFRPLVISKHLRCTIDRP